MNAIVLKGAAALELADPASPDQIVLSAITQADYRNKGAPFSPFLMKFAGQNDFRNIWTSQRGDQQYAFYAVAGPRADGFLPLGDYAIPKTNSLARTPIMLLGLDPGFPLALKHPTGFTWILDDKGSGNPDNLVYWWPTAPVGYTALGVCVTNGAQPDVNSYWCVANEHLQAVGVAPYWTDAGQHFKSHDGSLSVPAIGQRQSSDSLVLTPTTILSNEHAANNGGQTNAFALVVSKLLLKPQAPPPAPIYDDSLNSGSRTGQGVSVIAVLPANVVNDPGQVLIQDNPFYYVACEPYWNCALAFSSPNGGSYTMSCSVGVSVEQSSSFQQSTSLTVGADVGIEADSLKASMSVSYTKEMSITTESSQRNDKVVETTIQLNVPQSPRVLVWQLNDELVSYRTNGVSLSRATYSNPEVIFTAKPAG